MLIIKKQKISSGLFAFTGGCFLIVPDDSGYALLSVEFNVRTENNFERMTNANIIGGVKLRNLV